jgi:hypothetical protein
MRSGVSRSDGSDVTILHVALIQALGRDAKKQAADMSQRDGTDLSWKDAGQ